MLRAYPVCCLLLVALLCAGCEVIQPNAIDPSDQKPGPPRYVTPELVVALKAAGMNFTESPVGQRLDGSELDHFCAGSSLHMDEKLQKIGARLAPDGNLYDRNGKKIVIWITNPPRGGAQNGSNLGPTRQEELVRQRELETLRSIYVVVEMTWLGGLPH
ncbi:MAG TPA: hypothetical protein VE988_09840 [Gemmataceae bacterium]|nr:hypothetical protein [Gemmataceae bacterium]